MRILVIEDHPDIVQNLCDYFEGSETGVTARLDGPSGLAAAVGDGPWDAVVLDLTLPGMDGLEVCRRMRREFGIRTPVLMLTARDTLPDKLEGYEAGTDDYLTKPFALPELEARLKVLVRRHQERHAHLKHFRDITIDPSSRKASRRGQELALTPTGFRILATLLESAPELVTRENLEQRLWGDQPPGSDALRAHMATLRKELEKRFGDSVIETRYGVGFRLIGVDEAE